MRSTIKKLKITNAHSDNLFIAQSVQESAFSLTSCTVSEALFLASSTRTFIFPAAKFAVSAESSPQHHPKETTAAKHTTNHTILLPIILNANLERTLQIQIAGINLFSLSNCNCGSYRESGATWQLCRGAWNEYFCHFATYIYGEKTDVLAYFIATVLWW